MPKLLILEDEKILADNLKMFFSNMGYDVFATGDGQEALELIEKHNPPLLLIDLHLENSQINGIEVLKQAKQKHPNSKAIVLTGYGLAHTLKDKCLNYGADLFLCKPVSMLELKNTLDNYSKELK